MKIVLTYYPMFVRYSHGIALLSSILKQQPDLHVDILPMEKFVTPEHYRNAIENINPDYVCASFLNKQTYTESMPYILSIPNIPIMAGGPYLRMGGRVHDNLFQYVCRGEAETISDFFLHGDTSVFDEAKYCKNISDLPLPDYSNVVGDEFDRGMLFLKDKKIIPYSHSRGCPFKCNFCVTQFLPYPGRLRIKTTIKNDLSYLRGWFDPDLFFFMDELLPYYNSSWRKQFEGNCTGFTAYIRGDIKESELNFLIDNGLYACAFGVESANEAYRNKAFNKQLSDKDIYRTWDILDKNNVHNVSFFMTDTPGETEEIREHTLAMAASRCSKIWQYENLEEGLECLNG